MNSGLTRTEVEQSDQKNRQEKFLPVDIAGYMAAGADGKPADRFAAVWVESAEASADTTIQAGLDRRPISRRRRIGSRRRGCSR